MQLAVNISLKKIKIKQQSIELDTCITFAVAQGAITNAVISNCAVSCDVITTALHYSIDTHSIPYG